MIRSGAPHPPSSLDATPTDVPGGLVIRASSPSSLPVVSLDLPWSETSRGRAVAAFLGPRGRVGWVDLCRGLDVARISAWLGARCGSGAIVLLDIPIDGCDRGPGPFRPLDRRLNRMQMRLLPSSKAGALGARLRDAVVAAVPGARVLESHPYGCLRVLHALDARGVRGEDLLGAVREVLDDGFRAAPCPRYKRERDRARRHDQVDEVRRVLVRTLRPWGLEGDPADLAERSAGRAAADRLDALLGLVPGLLLARGSPWFFRAADPAGGAIALVADAWWRRTFERTAPVGAARAARPHRGRPVAAR
jgi:predicted nuclease with RNAse H fold